MSERYASLDAYTPGEQPTDMQYLKLNTNESPYPPSDGVLAAISGEDMKALRLYPDPDCTQLKDALAAYHGVGRENIFVSNGSDDILNFSFAAFTKVGKKAYFADITYGFYKVFSALHGIEYETIPLTSELSIRPEDYMGRHGLIVIANPNAPTGKRLDVAKIEEIACSCPDSVVLVDEAYVDFGSQSCISLTKKYDNVLVVRTYSKSRSMAGARLGYAIGEKELISDLEKIKFSTNPYSVNRLTMKAGVAALKDNDYYEKNCQRIIEAREYTEKQLNALGFEVIPSWANFVFARKDGYDGQMLYSKLKENGILVRHFGDERIADYIRITIGTMHDMEHFISVLKEITEKNDEIR